MLERQTADGEDLARRQFAVDLRASLSRVPRQIAPKYLYDELGSQLFEAICLLPWYRVTRAELRLLARHGREMLGGHRRAQGREPVHLVELGCGSGEKLTILAGVPPAAAGDIQLVDISPAALDMTGRRLAEAGRRVVAAHRASYEDGLARAVARRPSVGPIAVLFLGSNIGNFDPPEQARLLRRMRDALRPGDALLLGTDLVKPERELLLAYDDPLQVTAAFNRNLLRRINDELDGTFDLAGFAHRAVWNAAESRVEMHLRSLRRQRVEIPPSGLAIEFQPEETIWTESSYKFEMAGVRAAGLAAGFGEARQWMDEPARFALTRFEVEV